MKSLKERILTYVEAHPGKSAVQIAKGVDGKVSSVASMLSNFATKEGRMVRLPKSGPRQGYTYFMAPPPKPILNRFQRILKAS